MSDYNQNDASPLSPAPPRYLLATPLASSPSPRLSTMEAQTSLQTRALTKRREPIYSHFQVNWRQDQTTGIMTLAEPDVSTTLEQAYDSEDSDNDEERDGTTLSTATQSREKRSLQNWRNKERMRTMGVAIALCLNLGTDPPDCEKVPPCARTECGIDPTKYHIDAPAYMVLKMITTQLEEQFRNLQPRAKIKLAADPTVEMIRKTCTSLRKLAKTERILVHFNGHGVPRPTRNGEIWAFNEDFTQYIPLSILDLIRWTGHPAMFTFDCQSAGQLIPHFLDHEKDNERKYKQQLDEWRRNRARKKKEKERRDRRERENERLVKIARAQNVSVLLPPNSMQQGPPAANAAFADDYRPDPRPSSDPSDVEIEEERPTRKRVIVLVPCGADEALPSSPQLPADLFTCCLTLPIQTALKWFILQNRMTMEPLGIEQGMVNLIPGKAGERKSMLGELNWIFTAVTDTIAWSVLPRKLFQRLFRQDLLVASMLRHFLLAERIFRSLGCTPQSVPSLPSTWKHRMWDAWDQAVENCLIQLPGLIPARLLAENGFHKAARIATERQKSKLIPRSIDPASGGEGIGIDQNVESRFFKDQLQAFEIWLSQPSSSAGARPGASGQSVTPPEQLPVVLQVLLSLQYRVVALDQLARFLDLGQWAVSHALSVGIFPYVLKLLQNPVTSLKGFLVRIWVRILDLDESCRDELNQAKEQGYFIRQLSLHEDVEHASRAAFVLCISCMDDSESKSKCLAQDLDRTCLAILQSGTSLPEVDNLFPAPQRGNGVRSYGSRSDSEEGDSDSEGSDTVRRPNRVPAVSHQQVLPASSSPLPQRSPEPAPSPGNSVTKNHLLIRWCCILLATLWDCSEQARARAFNGRFYQTLEYLVAEDSFVSVREASAFALGRLLGPIYVDPVPPLSSSPATGASTHSSGPALSSQGGHDWTNPVRKPTTGTREEKPKSPEVCEMECDLAVRLLKAARQDCSPLVRRELILAVGRFVSDASHLGNFQLVVHFLSEYRQRSSQTQPALIDRLHASFGARGPKYMAIWLDLTRVLAVDPFPAVSQTAQILIRFVKGGVEARIEAIKGRAGETPSFGGALMSESKTILLDSDLFQRARRHICRTTQEREEDALGEATLHARLHRKLVERQHALDLWKSECAHWTSSGQANSWWYGEVEAFPGGDTLALKRPFLQLLRTQSSSVEGVSMAHSVTSPPPFTPASGDISREDSDAEVGRDLEPELVRRFDKLPSDLFSACRSTSGFRLHGATLASNSPNALLRQSSLSLPSLSREVSIGNVSRSSRGYAGDKSPVGNHRFEEVSRIELARFGIPLQQSYVAVTHPSAPIMVVAHQQTISCFDESGMERHGSTLVSRFSNLNVSTTTVSSMTWIDAATDPLLLTYAEDGHIRVWRDATTSLPSLVSAFSPYEMSSASATATAVATPSLSQQYDRRLAPLVEWISWTSSLICSSATSPAIRVWDLAAEKLLTELICTGYSGSGSSPHVTNLSSSDAFPMFAAGFSDGSARVFDQRSNGRFASTVVRASPSVEAVVNVSRISNNLCLATVTSSGSVRVWDVRMDRASVLRTELQVDGGDCLYAFHPNAPILACAQRRVSPQVVRIITLEDMEMSQVRPRVYGASSSSTFGFMGSANRPTKQAIALFWHPEELAFFYGTSDSITSFVACNTNLRGVWSPNEKSSLGFGAGIGSGTGGN